MLLELLVLHIKPVLTIVLSQPGKIAKPAIFEQLHALGIVFFVMHFSGSLAVSGGFEPHYIIKNLSITSKNNFSRVTILPSIIFTTAPLGCLNMANQSIARASGKRPQTW